MQTQPPWYETACHNGGKTYEYQQSTIGAQQHAPPLPMSASSLAGVPGQPIQPCSFVGIPHQQQDLPNNRFPPRDEELGGVVSPEGFSLAAHKAPVSTSDPVESQPYAATPRAQESANEEIRRIVMENMIKDTRIAPHGSSSVNLNRLEASNELLLRQQQNRLAYFARHNITEYAGKPPMGEPPQNAKPSPATSQGRTGAMSGRRVDMVHDTRPPRKSEIRRSTGKVPTESKTGNRRLEAATDYRFDASSVPAPQSHALSSAQFKSTPLMQTQRLLDHPPKSPVLVKTCATNQAATSTIPPQTHMQTGARRSNIGKRAGPLSGARQSMINDTSPPPAWPRISPSSPTCRSASPGNAKGLSPKSHAAALMRLEKELADPNWSCRINFAKMDQIKMPDTKGRAMKSVHKTEEAKHPEPPSLSGASSTPDLPSQATDTGKVAGSQTSKDSMPATNVGQTSTANSPGMPSSPGAGLNQSDLTQTGIISGIIPAHSPAPDKLVPGAQHYPLSLAPPSTAGPGNHGMDANVCSLDTVGTNYRRNAADRQQLASFSQEQLVPPVDSLENKQVADHTFWNLPQAQAPTILDLPEQTSMQILSPQPNHFTSAWMPQANQIWPNLNTSGFVPMPFALREENSLGLAATSMGPGPDNGIAIQNAYEFQPTADMQRLGNVFPSPYPYLLTSQSLPQSVMLTDVGQHPSGNDRKAESGLDELSMPPPPPREFGPLSNSYRAHKRQRF